MYNLRLSLKVRLDQWRHWGAEGGPPRMIPSTGESGGAKKVVSYFRKK